MINNRIAPFLIFLSLGSVCLVPATADWKDDIGYNNLVTELGGATPTGTGINVAMSEAGSAAASVPHVGDAQFSTKTFFDKNGVVITAPVIPPASVSHATSVARTFVGNSSSIASGVTSITSLNANDWINNELGFDTVEPTSMSGVKVMNNSWVSRQPTAAQFPDPVDLASAIATAKVESENLAKRVDFLVNRDDVLVVGGTDNGTTLPLPLLLAPSFNSLTVGTSSGNHVSGVTDFYQAGRTRPHLVAPAGVTSTATPMVSSTAAMLYEAAAGTNAEHVETMRAVLMAGATKEASFGWDRTDTRPIDETFGAGQVNAYNSFHAIDAGEVDGTLGALLPAASAGLTGFDFFDASMSAGTDSIYYEFDVDSGFVMDELSIFLSWNVDVQDDLSFGGFQPLVNFGPGGDLANLDLKLFDSSNALVQQSISSVDNYEHLYLTELGAGTYTLEIIRDQEVDFGLAWRSAVTAVPEPASFLATAVMMGGIALRRRRPTVS